MKTTHTFSIQEAKAALAASQVAIAAVKSNDEALAKDRAAQKSRIETLSLADLENEDSLVIEESRRDVRLRIREQSLARLRTGVADATRSLHLAFIELQTQINESVGREKKAFLDDFERLLLPVVRQYKNPLDASIPWRLSEPYDDLLGAVQQLDNISRESERDIFLRAEFYETRTGFALNMIAKFESQGRKWFVVPTE